MSMFKINLVAEYRTRLPEIKKSGTKHYIRIPATISSRLNTIRPKGSGGGKGLRGGRIERNIPKKVRKG